MQNILVVKQLTVDELESVISSDFACVNEYQLLQFILDWGAANDGNKYDVGRLLEHVRFTKMSMQHDPRPVTTRKLGRLKKMNS